MAENDFFGNFVSIVSLLFTRASKYSDIRISEIDFNPELKTVLFG